MIEVLVGFARCLRHAGMRVPPDRVQAMLAAVDALGVTDPAGVYWAGRLTLCAEPDDIATYDAAFAAYFRQVTPPAPVSASGSVSRIGLPFQLDQVAPRAERDDPEVIEEPAASDIEVLRHRDLTQLTDQERDEVRRLLTLLAPTPAPRPSRRRRPARRGEIDPARTVARILRRVGEPAPPAYRRKSRKPRRLVLLVDVSGSMAAYADALLRFAHAAVRRRPSSTEVFTVGTRLTRVTRALRHRDPDLALAASSRLVPDWSGGTRLGEALKVFLDRWGQRGMARGAVVVLFSDGWERGDPSLLADQMARLARLAHRVVWVNPHKGRPGYVPLVAGMVAALPHLDDFVAGHSFAALERLVEVIARA